MSSASKRTGQDVVWLFLVNIFDSTFTGAVSLPLHNTDFMNSREIFDRGVCHQGQY
jgi:hypothetical protein